MSKVAKRLIVFFVGVPVILAFVFFDFCQHLPLAALMTFFVCAGACEFYNMFTNANYKVVPKVVQVFFASILPVSSYLIAYFNLNQEGTFWIYISELLIIMAMECFTVKVFDESLKKIALSCFAILYCGYLPTFITRMTGFESANYYIALYLIFVFLCDSSAWAFGMLFGKSTRGKIAASPNKSIVGFIGGIVGSVVCGLLFVLAFRQMLEYEIWKYVLLGFLTAISAIIGDLIESVFKRATGVKDSGNIILGRGGALDSMDSLIAAAPIYYMTCVVLFGF